MSLQPCNVCIMMEKTIEKCELPWLSTPSSSSACHIPTAWDRVRTQALCSTSQSTSSVPTQHCLQYTKTHCMNIKWSPPICMWNSREILLPVCLEVVLPVPNHVRGSGQDGIAENLSRSLQLLWRNLQNTMRNMQYLCWLQAVTFIQTRAREIPIYQT